MFYSALLMMCLIIGNISPHSEKDYVIILGINWPFDKGQSMKVENIRKFTSASLIFNLGFVHY